MMTDPARQRRTDPAIRTSVRCGTCTRSTRARDAQAWAAQGCRTAGIGCLDCKKPVVDAVVAQISAMRARAKEFEENRDLVRGIIAEGNEKARDVRAPDAG